MRAPRRPYWAALLLSGCAAAATAPGHPSQPVSPPPASAPDPAPQATPTATPPAPPGPATAPSVRLLAFARVLQAPVHSLAFGKDQRVAALGEEAWLDVGKGFQRLPRPPNASPDVQIFFGRDAQPRLMGSAQDERGSRGVYSRFRGGAWQSGASEIGRLGGAPHAPLFGVLGYDDPEVVCKQADQCIIKRLTGWATIAGLPGTPRVALCGPTAWAFSTARVWRLEKSGWQELEGKLPFDRASALWATASDRLWITEPETNTLHRLEHGAWSRHASPIAGPRHVWATGESDVWVAGDGGTAHYDGTRWSKVEGAGERLLFVTGRSPKDVWLAGHSGVWHGTAE
jgi:hypothetical protein